jgi:hypothetical protein
MNKYYYLLNGKVMKGGEMPNITNPNNDSLIYGDTYIRRWLSSLQPCDISESEFEKIKNKVYTFNNCHADNPIDVTDIVEERNHTQLLRNPPIDKFELFFKQPKEVDSEIEAVESQESIWLEILDIIVNKPSQIRLDICKQKFKIKRNI